MRRMRRWRYRRRWSQGRKQGIRTRNRGRQRRNKYRMGTKRRKKKFEIYLVLQISNYYS